MATPHVGIVSGNTFFRDLPLYLQDALVKGHHEGLLSLEPVDIQHQEPLISQESTSASDGHEKENQSNQIVDDSTPKKPSLNRQYGQLQKTPLMRARVKRKPLKLRENTK